MSHTRRRQLILTPLAGAIVASLVLIALWGEDSRAEAAPTPAPEPQRDQARFTQSRDTVEERDRGCVSCHAGVEKMHAVPGVFLACTDCHGGNEDASIVATGAPGSEAYETAKNQAHVQPKNAKLWYSESRSPSANPERSYTALLKEAYAFIKFVNPGDLRVARETCGGCHDKEVHAVERHTMTTSAIFWAAAAYANGILPFKTGVFGESYAPNGLPRALTAEPTDEQIAKGARTQLLPLPRWETVQPGEYFRAFEPGGVLQLPTPAEIGNPNTVPTSQDILGKPDIRLSNRGRGTGLRVSPAIVNLQKTRLNNPHLSFMGTNEQPGDFRSSGCTACHVVYGNDRDEAHSGPWAQFGHLGESATDDPTIPKNESGHPIKHRFTRAIPTSQCMSCHMHQPNAFVNTYLGYIMWDYVSDGELFWPEKQRYPTEAEKRTSLESNPEGAAVRGLWSEKEFLAGVSELNDKAKHTQFADYHGHGWVFRAVHKRDRKGNLLDADGNLVAFDDPDKFRKAVHLKDIHLEKGMHCVDCHFANDSHGNGQMYSEYGDAIEVRCHDCHGKAQEYTNLRTSGPAAPPGGSDLSAATTPFGQRRFAWRQEASGRKLYQRSMVNDGMEWPVLQVKDTVTQGHPDYNELSARAKTISRDGRVLGASGDASQLAHQEQDLSCFACHTSWMTSCSGCHLPQEANVRSDMLHYEGEEARNYASYNPQVLRDDMFILGRNSTTKNNMIAPVRSSSALVLSSTNQNRQRFYMQQPPISAPGYSSQAFNPHVPHTVRKTETKTCTDCHLSEAGDNNAWMASVMGLGTNFPNFIGRYAWVATGKKGLEAVIVTEWDEPQPVIGSYLHSLVFPDFHDQHEKRNRELEIAKRNPAKGSVNDIQMRGEWVFTAAGKAGLRVFDIANIDNKDFSQHITAAPVSPLAQRTYVDTKDASSVALPTNMPVAPWRCVADKFPANQDEPMHPIYRYAFVSDREEGLVMVNVDTLTDGNPRNNFFKRTKFGNADSFNPDGVLDGANTATVVGNHVWVGAAGGLVAVDFGNYRETGEACVDPVDHRKLIEQRPEPIFAPEVVSVVDGIRSARAIEAQFRYLFVVDAEGLAVVDATVPSEARLAARLPIDDARGIYVARTYAYVAAGAQGLVIVNIENPENPFIDQIFDAGGSLNDSNDVKVASTSSSLFAYVADGANGLRVLQLTSPKTVPGYLGFSPKPDPQLIATKKTSGPAMAISKGLDRDRAVDESGNQVSIFNRIGSRPFTLEEMRGFYMKDGKLFTVTDDGRVRRAGADSAGGAAAGSATRPQP